jgi:type II secretory pathway pseudopilin PulG
MNPKGRRISRSLLAFTLIELLVVIAIIAQA